MKSQAQSLSVKRAEVEFHNFASLGEPERAMAVYAEENQQRAGLIKRHLNFIGSLSPFLEIGANVGHTSYLLANQFSADGFALDISADALRHGQALVNEWKLARVPIRLAGDAASLPFRDGSLRVVLAFQMLSQFMDIERVFLEVKRVLAPGGVFVFAEEPLRRLLSLRLYRCPYYERMNPWERVFYRWGLLGYAVKDVIGAEQEESFGIRQNHRLYLGDWHRLIEKHFLAHEYEIFVPERGWGERVVKNLAKRLDRRGSPPKAARWLGGTFAAMCRKAGSASAISPQIGRFEQFLQCPDCSRALYRDSFDALQCIECGYKAADDRGVYTLLPSRERGELYPGERGDIIDFCLPGHEKQLLEGWYELEGVFGNKYRWIGACSAARLVRLRNGPQRLRIRGYAHQNSFNLRQPVQLEVTANGKPVGRKSLSRPGLFVFEADLADAPEYKIQVYASPTWQAPPDDRVFSVNLSMLRLVPRVP